VLGPARPRQDQVFGGVGVGHGRLDQRRPARGRRSPPPRRRRRGVRLTPPGPAVRVRGPRVVGPTFPDFVERSPPGALLSLACRKACRRTCWRKDRSTASPPPP